MYDLTLINLAADARTVSAGSGKIEQRGVDDAAVRSLLHNFCAIDPVENATADPEIRVRTPDGTFLIRAAQKKLILYDLDDRDAPAQVLTPDDAMAELDGTAPAARRAGLAVQTLSRAPAPSLPVAPPPDPAARRRRIAVLGVVALALAAALLVLHRPESSGDGIPPFAPLPAREAAAARASLVGVYLTGTRPGDHGIVIAGTGDLRLFELRAVRAPGMVYATGRVGRVGPTLALATDQPGGVILIPNRRTLVYCGETYQRAP